MRVSQTSADCLLCERGNCGAEHFIEPFRDVAVLGGGLVNGDPLRRPPSIGKFVVPESKVKVASLADSGESFIILNNSSISEMTFSEVALGRDTLGSRLCSAATQMAEAMATGRFEERADGEVALLCDLTTGPTGTGDPDRQTCFIDITADRLSLFSRLYAVGFGGTEEIVLRVKGDGVVTYNALDTSQARLVVIAVTETPHVDPDTGETTHEFMEVENYTTLRDDLRVLIYFEDADSVNVVFRSGDDGQFADRIAPVFAPFAKDVNVFQEEDGDSIREARFILGNSESVLSLFSAGYLPSNGGYMGLLPTSDSTHVEIHYCSCLCDPAELPEEEVRLRCVEDEEFRVAELIIEGQFD
eukprot:Selendium_serpulae@DN6308_c0_g1_i5.p1